MRRIHIVALAAALSCAACGGHSQTTLKEALSHGEWVDFSAVYGAGVRPVVVCDPAWRGLVAQHLGVDEAAIPDFSDGTENVLLVVGSGHVAAEKYPVDETNLCTAPRLRPAGVLRDVPQRFESRDGGWVLDSTETEELDLY